MGVLGGPVGWGRLEEAEPLSLAQSSEPAEFFPQFLCMFEENYPETLKRLFIVKGKLGTTCDEAKWEGGAENVPGTNSGENKHGMSQRSGWRSWDTFQRLTCDYADAFIIRMAFSVYLLGASQPGEEVGAFHLYRWASRTSHRLPTWAPWSRERVARRWWP